MHMLCLAVLHPVLLLNILLCEYITYHCLLIDMWVISSLVLLQGVPLQAYVFMSSMHTLYTFLLRIYPGMRLLGYREAISSTSVNNVKPFSNMGKAIITTSCVQGFQGFHTRTRTLNIGIFSFRYLVSQSGFSLVFSDTK